jgi:hypothetical protein
MLFKVGVYVCIHSRLRESLVESMSGYSFACGIRSLDLANPRTKVVLGQPVKASSHLPLKMRLRSHGGRN